MPTVQTTSLAPVVVAAPDRGDDLEVRVTAPTAGSGLPVVVLSHGYSFSMDAYGRIADHWARGGFVVLQPTHLDAFALGLAPDDPRTSDVWRTRIDDLVRVLDGLDALVAAVPGLAGRVDLDAVALAGHSFGATSASALLGARTLGPVGDPDEDRTDPRVRTGVLLSVAGEGDDLTPFAEEHFGFMRPDFGPMRTPTLVVAGADDQSRLSHRGPEWFTEAHRRRTGPGALVVLAGAEHSLGGIEKPLGMAEREADSADQVALVQRATLAWLRSALRPGSDDWPRARGELRADAGVALLEER